MAEMTIRLIPDPTTGKKNIIIIERTDDINQQAETHLDLGEVLRLASNTEDAATAVAAAERLFEAKGNVVVSSHFRPPSAER